MTKRKLPDADNCNRNECFGYTDGKCKPLCDTNFGNRKCPFFKTKKRIEEEEQRVQSRKEQEA